MNKKLIVGILLCIFAFINSILIFLLTKDSLTAYCIALFMGALPALIIMIIDLIQYIISKSGDKS